MKKQKGIIQDISYQVDCPHCNETSYSDVNSGWDSLEYGDGYPSGELKCDECSKSFYLTIEV